MVLGEENLVVVAQGDVMMIAGDHHERGAFESRGLIKKSVTRDRSYLLLIPP